MTYVFYECEEVDVARNGLFKLSRSAPELLAGDFAVLLEPSGGAVEGGCQGTLRAAVTATGVRAHTARSWMGRNAIHEAAEILEVLRSWEARHAGRRRAGVPRGAERGRDQRRRRGERRARLLHGDGELPVRA